MAHSIRRTFIVGSWVLVKERAVECAIASQASRFFAMSASTASRRGSSDGNSALLGVPHRVPARTIWMSAPSTMPPSGIGFRHCFAEWVVLEDEHRSSRISGRPPFMVTGSRSSVHPIREVDARKPPMLGGASAEAVRGTSPQMLRGSTFRATAGFADGRSGAAVGPSAAASRQASRRSPTRAVRPACAR